MLGFGVAILLYYVAVQMLGGAHEAIEMVLSYLSRDTTVTLEGNTWFAQQFGLIRTMALWVMMPLVLLAIIQAVAKGDLYQIFKTALVYPAVALLGAVAAIRVVQLLIGISDDFSNVFLASVGEDVNTFFTNLRESSFLEDSEDFVGKWVIVIILSTLLMFAGGVTFLMLIVREASIYLATAFLPLGFAMLVWPATMKWFRTMVEFLIGIIFSKVLMCAIIAVGVASLSAAGFNEGTQESLQLTGGTVTGDDDGDSLAYISALGMAIVMLFMAGAAPGAAIKMVGSFGLDNAAAALASSVGTRPRLRTAFLGVNRQLGAFNAVKGALRDGRALRKERDDYRQRKMSDMMLAANGNFGDGKGESGITPGMTDFIRDRATGLEARGLGLQNPASADYDPIRGAELVDEAAAMRLHAKLIRDLGASSSVNDRNYAHALLEAYSRGGSVMSNTGLAANDPSNPTYFNRAEGYGRIVLKTPNADGSQDFRSIVVDPIMNREGREINRINTQAVINRLNNEQQFVAGVAQANGPNNSTHVTYLSGRGTARQGRQTERLQKHFDKTNVNIRGNTRPTQAGPNRISYINPFDGA